MYKICREMYDDGVGLPFQSQPDLIGDKYVMQCLLDLGVDISKAGLPGCGEMKTRNTEVIGDLVKSRFNRVIERTLIRCI